MPSSDARLLLPALRARMGDWVYYLTRLKMKDITSRVSFAEQLHESRSLNDLIQREVSERAIPISEYLQTQPQRFFNALVIGIYGGDPQWYEIGLKANSFLDPEDVPQDVKGALGILILEGDESLFAIDGQHRVKGIKGAVAAKASLGDEEVAAVFVSHRRDAPGLKRTRRLFTTLNRYAKPVTKSEIIARDEDDVVAIVTRRLVDEHPLFRDKISLAKGKNIPGSDKSSLTTIVTLYDALNTFLSAPSSEWPRGEWRRFQRIRPNDKEIETYVRRGGALWDLMSTLFEPLARFRRLPASANAAGRWRNERGGHLLFRPIGLLMAMAIIRSWMDLGHSPKDAIRRLKVVPMKLNRAPWVGLIWDNTNRRMVTESANQRVAKKILWYATGGDLAVYNTTLSELKQEVAGILNVSPSEVKLRKYGS